MLVAITKRKLLADHNYDWLSRISSWEGPVGRESKVYREGRAGRGIVELLAGILMMNLPCYLLFQGFALDNCRTQGLAPTIVIPFNKKEHFWTKRQKL